MEQYGTVLYFAVIVGVFYFLLVRPQMKRQKEHAALMSSLSPGDRVVTSSGIHGSVRVIGDETVDIEIADGVVVSVSKAAVGGRVEE